MRQTIAEHVKSAYNDVWNHPVIKRHWRRINSPVTRNNYMPEWANDICNQIRLDHPTGIDNVTR